MAVQSLQITLLISHCTNIIVSKNILSLGGFGGVHAFQNIAHFSTIRRRTDGLQLHGRDFFYQKHRNRYDELVRGIQSGAAAGKTIPSTSLFERYSKGAEIYPPTNQNSFKLEDSFPGGNIPSPAQSILADDSEPILNGQSSALEGTLGVGDEESNVSKILSSASQSQEERIEMKRQTSLKSVTVSKFPLIVAVAMVSMGLVPPSQVLFVVFFSGYLITLGFMASSPMDYITSSISSNNDSTNIISPRSIRQMLPSLPPQGHVPEMLKNPLGSKLTYSVMYRRWLQCGAWLGFVLPLFAAGLYKRTNQLFLATQAATCVFSISCQVITESIAKRVLAPLPIRILIPIVYNCMRMGSLYDWVRLGHKEVTVVGRVLSIANFLYWGANLFGFLIPVASLRYLRSHFFCVEAQEVVLREKL